MDMLYVIDAARSVSKLLGDVSIDLVYGLLLHLTR